jgi:hypothetical protein
MKFWSLLLGLLGFLLPLAAQMPTAPGLSKVALPPKETFKIYLLMGQSNMAGRGTVNDVHQPDDAHILVFNRDNKWAVAADPLHWDKEEAGVGPGLGFALHMRQQDPQVTIGLVPCAVGGSPLSKWMKGQPLYEAAVHRAKAAMRSGTLAGVLWHQGESDATPDFAPTYGLRLEKMLMDLRATLHEPNLPIVLGETGRFNKGEFGAQNIDPALLKTVNEGIHAAGQKVPNVRVVDSKGLKHRGDQLHFDAVSARELGKRYAEAMLQLQRANP